MSAPPADPAGAVSDVAAIAREGLALDSLRPGQRRAPVRAEIIERLHCATPR